MTHTIRTDLVLEAREFIKEQAAKQMRQEQEVKGIEVETAGSEDVKVTRVKVVSPAGEAEIGKPMGSYITVEAPRLRENSKDLYEDTSRTVAIEIGNIINIPNDAPVLIVGLGNWNVTPDALGPRVVSKVMVTRHMIQNAPEEVQPGTRPVCAIAPGVLGITGMETGEIIQGVVEKTKPALVIAIDALASRKMERVSTTIQMADTGISPGSGVGNKRMSLTKQTLGIPVIAVGVPTVVDAATIASDAIDMVLENMAKQTNGSGNQFYDVLKNMEQTQKYTLIQDVLSPYVGNLMVTPKEIDEIIDNIAGIIANGLNIALHESIGLKDVDRFLN